MAEYERVGFIGLGIMGSLQAANLSRGGVELTVFNRTAESAAAWAAEHGAKLATTPAALAADSDVVITMVTDGAAVADVLLGPDGVAEGAPDNLLCVDMSTIGPQQTRDLGGALAERGISLIDAPVTGSAPRAADATLTIVCGGEPAHIARARPLLELMGSRVVEAGPLGHGEAVKLINNSVAAVNCATVAQALLVGRATGLDLDALVEVMSAGSGASAMLDLKADPMREHDFAALFKLEHMLKDVLLCLEQGAAAGVDFPAAAEVSETLAAGVASGHGGDDFAALIEVYEALAGLTL